MEEAMSFSPYLFFVGTCREAMTAYQGIFGGQLDLVTAADMPDAPDGVPADAIMHAALTLDGGAVLMASDDPGATEDGPKVGLRVSYSAASPEDATRVFDALAVGGDVQMPMGPTSWSAAFGMCVDRYGTPWMVGADAAE
jgi:PhnB protein